MRIKQNYDNTKVSNTKNVKRASSVINDITGESKNVGPIRIEK